MYAEYIPITLGQMTPIDRLCERCLNPALFRANAYAMSDDGPIIVGIWEYCDDCDSDEDDDDDEQDGHAEVRA